MTQIKEEEMMSVKEEEMMSVKEETMMSVEKGRNNVSKRGRNDVRKRGRNDVIKKRRGWGPFFPATYSPCLSRRRSSRQGPFPTSRTWIQYPTKVFFTGGEEGEGVNTIHYERQNYDAHTGKSTCHSQQRSNTASRLMLRGTSNTRGRSNETSRT